MQQIKIDNKHYLKVKDVKYHGRKEYGSVWFKPLLNQMEMKNKNFYINNKLVMKQNEEYNILFVKENIWLFFRSEFGYNNNEIGKLIKDMVEEKFKIEVFSPSQEGFIDPCIVSVNII